MKRTFLRPMRCETAPQSKAVANCERKKTAAAEHNVMKTFVRNAQLQVVTGLQTIPAQKPMAASPPPPGTPKSSSIKKRNGPGKDALSNELTFLASNNMKSPPTLADINSPTMHIPKTIIAIFGSGVWYSGICSSESQHKHFNSLCLFEK